jgi:hypothetical protein
MLTSLVKAIQESTDEPNTSKTEIASAADAVAVASTTTGELVAKTACYKSNIHTFFSTTCMQLTRVLMVL